jgi:tetratricopeptide (TPR) repeat protein
MSSSAQGSAKICIQRGLMVANRGQLDQAVGWFRQAVQADGQCAEAHYYLGVALHQQDLHDDAASSYARALELDPSRQDAATNLAGLGELRQGRRDLEGAIAIYQQVLRFRPDFAEVHNNLGAAFLDLARLEEAASCFQQAIRCQPHYAEAYFALGNVFELQKRFSDAAWCFQQVIRLVPDHAAAHHNLKRVLAAQNEEKGSLKLDGEKPAAAAYAEQAVQSFQRGLHAQHSGDLAQALEHYQNALRVQPDLKEAWFNLGIVFDEQGTLNDAVAAYQRAVELAPQDPQGHNNLGVALAKLGRHEQAAEQYQQALSIAPQDTDALANLGVAWMHMGRLEDAERCYEEVLRREPGHRDALRNRGLLYLLQGDLVRGWPEYERHCWTRGGWRPQPAPIWDGSDLAGRTVLLQAGFGQGLGDIIQSLRYAALVKQRGGTVLVECPPPLLTLAATCAGIDRLVPGDGDYPAFDVQIVMLSLPPLFSSRVETVPANIPYLFADERLVQQWREALADDVKFKIGIAWQGNPRNEPGLDRSAPLAQFAPLAQVPGVSLYSLQVGAGSEQLAGIDFPVTDLGKKTTPPHNLAALMRNLDLVVAVDTMVAHLAGALGVPVWIALSRVPDPRWLLGRSDSPWYPTARLFRQKQAGDWNPVFADMAHALKELAE